MAEKNKSGAGKFFLGALLGGVAGAIAGRFISVKAENEESEGCECGCKDGKCKCGKDCRCGEDCECHKKNEKNAKGKAEE